MEFCGWRRSSKVGERFLGLGGGFLSLDGVVLRLNVVRLEGGVRKFGIIELLNWGGDLRWGELLSLKVEHL